MSRRDKTIKRRARSAATQPWIWQRVARSPERARQCSTLIPDDCGIEGNVFRAQRTLSRPFRAETFCRLYQGCVATSLPFALLSCPVGTCENHIRLSLHKHLTTCRIPGVLFRLLSLLVIAAHA